MSLFDKSPLEQLMSEKKYTKAQMDEYAKQECSDFAEWIAKTEFYKRSNGTNEWFDLKERLPVIKTTEQLYELYLQSKTKNK